MSKIVQPTHKGVNATLLINDEIVGGQLNCVLNRTMRPITITNRINGNWAESLAGVRGWSLKCSGMFIKDQNAFNILEQAFYNGDSVSVKITDGNREYYGNGLITHFPVNAAYNDTYVYNVTILGTGVLND